MDKLTGFLEFRRESPKGCPPEERVKDWEESHAEIPDEVLGRQGSRCMGCGTLFCHT